MKIQCLQIFYVVLTPYRVNILKKEIANVVIFRRLWGLAAFSLFYIDKRSLVMFNKLAHRWSNPPAVIVGPATLSLEAYYDIRVARLT